MSTPPDFFDRNTQPFYDGYMCALEMKMAQACQESYEPCAIPADCIMSSKQDWELLEEDSHRVQAHTLSQYRNCTNGAMCILWKVDAKKLRSSERQAVSPLFNAPLPFKMTIVPEGGTSFRKAGGRASIQLKCEVACKTSECFPVTFYLSVGSGHECDLRRPSPRGPITCDFARKGMCGLPKECDMWDLLSVIDEQSQMFVVCLEIMPCHMPLC